MIFLEQSADDFRERIPRNKFPTQVLGTLDAADALGVATQTVKFFLHVPLKKNDWRVKRRKYATYLVRWIETRQNITSGNLPDRAQFAARKIEKHIWVTMMTIQR